jgi:hypothetical protein
MAAWADNDDIKEIVGVSIPRWENKQGLPIVQPGMKR